MLKEIKCDKFIEKGLMRAPIHCHYGLNSVIGSDNGANSIGKSTFLLILDFIFAGDDYVNEATDVIENVGNHVIEYQFVFDDKAYYFSRSTAQHNRFNVCDAHYKIKTTIDKTAYCEFLLKHYHMESPDLMLRETISPFIRVWGRDTLDESKPLLAAKKQPDKNGIAVLLKLFNRFSEVKEQEEVYKEANERKKAFSAGQKYEYIATVKNVTVYKDNEQRVHELEIELSHLTKENNDGLLELSSFQAQQLSSLRLQLSDARRERTKLIAQKKNFEAERDPSNQTFQKDFESLRTFFPEANIKHLTEVEHFHKTLAYVLKKEFTESASKLQEMIDLSLEHVSALEDKIKEINDIPTVSEAVLERYAQVQRELYLLRESNKNFDTMTSLQKTASDLKMTYDRLVRDTFAAIQREIDDKTKIINDAIFNGLKTPPLLAIKSANEYEFFTPNDRGTGSEYKGLIVFDLAMLELTALPILVHDSVLLKQIQDDALEKILELYSRTDKQVFIAFDREATYSQKTQELLKNSEILHLYPNGGELFGHAWNIKTNK